MDNRLILIAGSGRSGTSLLSGILKAMGGYVPQPEVSADETNPHGFGEPQWVVDFHTKLLREVGIYTSDARPSAWAKTAELGRGWEVQTELETWVRGQFRNGDHVVVKDPRLLWFIPLWKRAGETVAAPCFVTTLRHPLEVIKSKQTYYGGPWHPNNRVAGWLNTMLFTERSTRGSRRTMVRYDDLLSDWMQALAQASEALDLALIDRAHPNQMRDASRLVDPTLRRARATWSSLAVDDRLVELAEETWGIFDRAVTTGAHDDPSMRSDLDRLREIYVSLYAFAESLAQSSVSAAQRDGRSKQRRDRSLAGNPPLLSVRGAHKLRRVRRKVRRALNQFRSRDGDRTLSGTTPEAESSPSQTQQQ
jgi:hypothetical protein